MTACGANRPFDGDSQKQLYGTEEVRVGVGRTLGLAESKIAFIICRHCQMVLHGRS